MGVSLPSLSVRQRYYTAAGFLVLLFVLGYLGQAVLASSYNDEGRTAIDNLLADQYHPADIMLRQINHTESNRVYWTDNWTHDGQEFRVQVYFNRTWGGYAPVGDRVVKDRRVIVDLERDDVDLSQPHTSLQSLAAKYLTIQPEPEGIQCTSTQVALSCGYFNQSETIERAVNLFMSGDTVEITACEHPANSSRYGWKGC